MSLSISAGSSLSSVTLAMFRTESAGPRRPQEGGHLQDGHPQATTPLATAMADALRTLGWVPQAAAPAPAPAAPAPTAPTTGAAPVDATAEPPVTTDGATPVDAPVTPPEADAAPADLPAAMANFAEALMAALREAGGSHGRGRDRDGDGLRDHGDHGRRAWGYGRAVGVIAVRLERMIGELKAALPAPAPAAGPLPADGTTAPPVAAPAPADPAPAPTVDASAPAVPAPTEPAPAPEGATTTDAPGGVDAAAAPAPASATSPLADAFAQLVDALRDNGAAVPADGDPASQMVDFLQALSGGLKPEGGGTTAVTGLFLRISV